MKFKALVVCAALAATPAAAQQAAAPAAAPAASPAAAPAPRVISTAAPSTFHVDGVTTGAVRSDLSIEGGQSLRVPVPGRSDQPWSVNVTAPMAGAVKAGDMIALTFWARLEQGEDGATSATLPFNAVQLSAAPYTSVIQAGVTVGPEWRRYRIQGRATRDYAAGELNVAIHLASGRHVIDLGPIAVLDMGPAAAAARPAPAAAASPAPAARPAAGDDLVDRIISIPAPGAYRVDGPRGAGRVRNDPAVQGGKALRVTVANRSAEAWRVGVAVPIQRAVASGDNLVLAFWARLERGENGATTSTLPNNAVQLASEPYTPILAGPVTVTSEWKLFEITGRAARAYAAGELNVALHLGNAEHVVDIGPVFVLNMGQ